MTGRVVHLLVVDDHWMVASALAQALAHTGQISITGVAGSVEELRQHYETGADASDCPDVAVVDYHLPDGTGVDAARLLAQHCPLIRTVLMSSTSSPAWLREALNVGCVGYVNKASTLDELTRAVHAAARGEATFDAASLHAALTVDKQADEPPNGAPNLSRREAQILAMLAAGTTTEVMATELFLSPHTVRNHVRNLTAKLGAHSRLEAVSIAARAGLLTLIQSTDSPAQDESDH